jgi:hypothetical protein
MNAQKSIEKLEVMKCDDDYDNHHGEDVFAKPQRRTTRGGIHANGHRDGPPIRLMRTKSLLLAALRVWELKHRVAD